MSEGSKILDVTYGAFSCRLEGFDDSVETMKAVVTFFHDLAGHDQFMDMAPQAPDLDTLAELTAEQTGMPVEIEAETDGQHLSLRLRQTEAEEPVSEDERPSLRVERDAETDISLAAQPEPEHEEVEQQQNAEETAFDEDIDPEAFSAETDKFAEDDIAFPESMDEDDNATSPITEEPETAAPISETPTESVAAKLQRIRAVVGRDMPSNSDDTYLEDQTEAPRSEAPATNPLAQRLAELAQRNATKAAEQPKADAVEADTSSFEETDADDEPLMQEEITDFSAEGESTEIPEEPQISGDTDEMSADETEPSGKDEDEVAQDDSKKEDDFNLKEQIAEVERTIAQRRERISRRNELTGNVDASVSRILTTADQRLSEPENRKQRDAFAQLKAAVVATEAARELGDPGTTAGSTSDEFREDLDVHEAKGTGENAKRPDVTPLRLVPAQRVDLDDQPENRATDRLRQIASKKESSGEKSGGFAEFAASKGATELLDLLEAAAAYIAFVEGDQDFSRPQVMKKVQMASASEFSREDGLRSFGRLLRQSRIIKLNNGRFQVSEDTRFRPDAKAAQG